LILVVSTRWRQEQLDKKARGKKYKNPDRRLPVTARFFSTLLGVTSETFADSLGQFVRENLPNHEDTPKKGTKVFFP